MSCCQPKHCMVQASLFEIGRFVCICQSHKPGPAPYVRMVSKRVGDPDEPVGVGPMARTEDPNTSHTAARQMKLRKEKLVGLQRLALSLVMAYPGRTATEYARISAHIDSRTIPRRLRELERGGMIREGESRFCTFTHQNCLTWWPLSEE